MDTPSEKIDILGVQIDAIDILSACHRIRGWIGGSSKAYVCIAPVSTIVDCQNNPRYREIINNSAMTTPDGMPLVWLGRLKGHKNIARTYGPDLMLAMCDLSRQKGYKNYFYGGTEEACRLLEMRLKERFPGLVIAGKYAPPFRELSQEKDDAAIAEINRADPDILWVGLGSPKQDYWMHKHRDKLRVPVMIGVGAAFDFLSGLKPQAPRWMQKMGLEWFFRLCCEPRRLWKRYLIGNTKFIYFLARNFLFKK